MGWWGGGAVVVGGEGRGHGFALKDFFSTSNRILAITRHSDHELRNYYPSLCSIVQGASPETYPRPNLFGGNVKKMGFSEKIKFSKVDWG